MGACHAGGGACSLALPETTSWARVVDLASRGVVSLRISLPRSFEGELPQCAIATGFVVDKKIGLILTNRHVVSPGPCTAEAIFANHEEALVSCVFRDPLHDFGLFKFDPADIEHMDIAELELYPQGAKIGTQIRVVGNDAGERSQVLAGTISRIDREAPEYQGSYCDNNTYYISAASSTSGGSSGSPVLDINGRCVGLNAGAAVQAASSFFLPLDRVVRAVDHLRQTLLTPSTAPLPRGTLHAIFVKLPVDELRRLGLEPAREAVVRARIPAMTGMLVCARVVPGGVAAKVGMCEGDILLSVDSQIIVHFTPLEEILDNAVATQGTVKTLELELRRGSETITLTVAPKSLWDTLPDEYLEYSGGILHQLSYIGACLYNVEFGLVLVSFPGFSLANAGVMQGSIITKVGTESIKSLDDFQNAINSYSDGAKVPIRFFHLSMINVETSQVMVVDRKWFSLKRAKRDDKQGTWVYSSSASPRASLMGLEGLPRPSDLVREKSDGSLSQLGLRDGLSDIEHLALAGLVWISFRTPFQIDGLYHTSYVGVGVVLDLQRGIIMADRNTVVSLLGDVRVTVASILELEGKPVFLHPLHNIAFVRVDPIALQKAGAVELKLFASSSESSKSSPVMDVRRGDQFTFAGLSNQQHLKVQPDLRVTSIERANISTPSTPRFTAKNFDICLLDSPPSGVVGGVFFSKKQTQWVISSVWASYAVEQSDGVMAEVFYAGLTHAMSDALTLVRRAIDAGTVMPPIYGLGVEFGRLEIAEARSGYKLSSEWVQRLVEAANKDTFGAGGGSREVLNVGSIMAGVTALKAGDLVLAVEGAPFVSYVACERACQWAGESKVPVNLTVLRDGEVLELAVTPMALSPLGTTRIVSFSGLQLQETHDAVLFHGYLPANLNGARGVFISRVSFGSPANSVRLAPGRWIISVDETNVNTLQDFLDVAVKLKDKASVRLKLIDLLGAVQVLTMRLDTHYFPTSSLSYVAETGSWSLDEL